MAARVEGGEEVAVVIYTTPTCPHCAAAKRFLRERSIPFREVDVTKSTAAAQEVVRKSGQMGVPVIDVNGRIVVGFDRQRLVQALGLRG
jgi:glutaredoxin 3